MVLTLAVVGGTTLFGAWIASTTSSATPVAASPTSSTAAEPDIEPSSVKASDGLQPQEHHGAGSCSPSHRATSPEPRPGFEVQHSAGSCALALDETAAPLVCSPGMASEGSDSRIENADDSTRVNEPVCQVAEMGFGIFCDFVRGDQE